MGTEPWLKAPCAPNGAGCEGPGRGLNTAAVGWDGCRKHGNIAGLNQPIQAAVPSLTLINIRYFKGRPECYSKKMWNGTSTKAASFSLLTIGFRLIP